jgi:hypothetical protein
LVAIAVAAILDDVLTVTVAAMVGDRLDDQASCLTYPSCTCLPLPLETGFAEVEPTKLYRNS